MDQALRNQIISIINDVDDMTIATVREDGFPQATTVSYMNDGFTIYFMTSADAQKAQNISRNNKISLTINRPYEHWDEIESLSMGGVAMAVSDPAEQENIGKLLMQKFPQAADYEPDGEYELALFRVDPNAISVIDYKKGFGHTELVEI